MSEQEFLSESKDLSERHSEVAEKFLLDDEETTEQTGVERSGNKRCIDWGTIPDTGRDVCLEWAEG